VCDSGLDREGHRGDDWDGRDDWGGRRLQLWDLYYLTWNLNKANIKLLVIWGNWWNFPIHSLWNGINVLIQKPRTYIWTYVCACVYKQAIKSVYIYNIYTHTHTHTHINVLLSFFNPTTVSVLLISSPCYLNPYFPQFDVRYCLCEFTLILLHVLCIH